MATEFLNDKVSFIMLMVHATGLPGISDFKRRYPLWLLGFAFGVSAMSPVSADEFHYKDQLIGDRASGMGGAFTAISDDPSGLYYNPAGVVFTPHRELSAAGNVYTNTTATYDNVNAPGQIYERKSTTTMANFFGVFEPTSRGMIGLSMAVPDALQMEQDQLFRNYDSQDPDWKITDDLINTYTEDSTILFGPSYAQSVTGRFALGMTLYVHMRKKESSYRQDRRFEYQGSDGSLNGAKGYDVTFTKSKTNELGVRPVLGMMWTLGDKASLGLSMAKTILLDQTPQAQVSINRDMVECRPGDASTYAVGHPCEGVTYPANQSAVLQLVTTPNDGASNTHFGNNIPVGMVDQKDRETPMEVAIGLGWFPSDQLLYALDLNWYGETSTNAMTWNVAAGVEYFTDASWSFRGGVFSNQANTASDLSQGEHVDLWGATAAISKNNLSNILTLGLSYAAGSGETNIGSDDNAVQTVTIGQFSATLSVATHF